MNNVWRRKSIDALKQRTFNFLAIIQVKKVNLFKNCTKRYEKERTQKVLKSRLVTAIYRM